MTRWQSTALSVSPPSLQVAAADRRALRFEAGEAITGASAAAVDLATGEDAEAIVEDVSTDADGATVTVSGLTRAHTYDLAVTFTRADTTSWTRTLALRCVA